MTLKRVFAPGIINFFFEKYFVFATLPVPIGEIMMELGTKIDHAK
jgi:hypothetical protein